MSDRYPMCEDQPAQIDCRASDCIFNIGAGHCNNISPAITLNPNVSYVCWSKETKEDEPEAVKEGTVKQDFT